MNKKNWARRRVQALRWGVAAALLGAASSGFADTFGVQLGAAYARHDDVKKIDLGFVWDPGLTWWDNGNWHFSLIGEAHLAYWRASLGDNRNVVWEGGVTPIVRFIEDSGAIRPFVEAGVGVRLLSHPTVVEHYSLSTAFQFSPMIGVGAQFGSHQQYQVGFRLQHLSNAGIKDPNPGINFSQLYLRYNF